MTISPAVRIGLAIASGLAVLAIVLAALWWVVLRPIEAQREAGQAKVDAKLGKAAGDVAISAIPQIREAERQKLEIDVKVQKGIIDVRQAPGAGVEARGVSDALLRNLCLLDRKAEPERTEQPVHVDPACERIAGQDAAR